MRARDLGVVPGPLAPGPVNAITDVPGIRVGHTTLIEGDAVRTGVTAIVHDALTGRAGLPASLFAFNRFGKVVGSIQAGRVARRCITAMARTGSDFSGHSGDYALAFSTVPVGGAGGETRLVPENDLNGFLAAAMDAAEEAILNSLFMAESMTGFRGHYRSAVPLDQVRELARGPGQAAIQTSRPSCGKAPGTALCSESHTARRPTSGLRVVSLGIRFLTRCEPAEAWPCPSSGGLARSADPERSPYRFRSETSTNDADNGRARQDSRGDKPEDPSH
jgi:Peptidase family S58